MLARSLSNICQRGARNASTVAPAALYETLGKNGIDTYYGVPDSLLKDFCSYVTDKAPAESHIIAANEGTACGLASGYHLGTGKIPVVYLQNSGLGNVLNPVMSLMHERVYSIPMLMMVGWRGEPGKKDEPQHTFMGECMEDVMNSMRMKYAVLPDNIDDAEICIKEAVDYMNREKAPFGLLIQKGVFEKYKLQTDPCPDMYPLQREEAIRLVASALPANAVCVSTTGMPSRELYEHRVTEHGFEGATGRDFMCVGNMGHCSSIALGLAATQPNKPVVCIDGDGSVVMHMGSLVTSGVHGPSNFKHVVFNNAAHDSVGGQPTYAYDFNIPDIAAASGYKGTRTVSTPEEIAAGVKWMNETDGPVMLEVRIRKGARSDLGRPKSTPIENKDMFMKYAQA
eukprot:TRINITY_DN17874_c0_g1_i2.p1 TRINITY_DN17874_c0_g1~~TRINITY_DN17874_c0_g1_i2.p1  ORF type:complete len:398 (+),score=83.55 TRINITY_DN17874_c0_g1_i2:146-1339(+)